MTADHRIALEWIIEEFEMGGMHTHPMPFKLERFRGVRDYLLRSGLVMKTSNGRYVPVADVVNSGQAFEAPQTIGTSH